MSAQRDCIHGHLARSCELCAAQNDHATACEQIDRLRAELAAERGRAGKAEAALRQIGKSPESCGDDCTSELARQDVIAERDTLRAENERLLGAVQRAYGYLWHVNNEPGTPNQCAPEQAAHAARRELRELLTHEQRGEGIKAARAATERDHASYLSDVDAIMPIVERAVKEAAWQGASAHSEKGRVYQADIDAIVARVMGDEAN